jgi:transcription elongation factor GreA
VNPSALSATRTHLINQLIYFDDSYSLFFDTYFPEQSRERSAMEKKIRSYLQELEGLLKLDDEALDQTLKSRTFVGSSVKIRYEDGYDETFTVVYPTAIDPDKNRISFLSPIGRQLLMAKAGDSITLETPVENHQVRVEEVKLSFIDGFIHKT